MTEVADRCLGWAGRVGPAEWGPGGYVGAPNADRYGCDVSEPSPEQTVAAWFDANIPTGWFAQSVDVVLDRDEVLVTGTLHDPLLPPTVADSQRTVARTAMIAHFREATRADRMALASAAEAMLGRKVSWAVVCGPLSEVFTAISVPVMTRLRMSERMVLDTLVDASVARTRSEALAWCVRLVSQHQGTWIGELREAMVEVERVRRAGPTA